MIKELAEFEKELDQVSMPLPSTRSPLPLHYTSPQTLFSIIVTKRSAFAHSQEWRLTSFEMQANQLHGARPCLPRGAARHGNETHLHF